MSYATYEEQMMTEALEEHNNGCCTEDVPCIMRTGVTKALASHKLTPDFRVREERMTQTGNGRGRTWSGKKVSPTEAQLRFWQSLLSQLREMGQTELADASEKEWDAVTAFKDYSKILDGTKAVIQALRKRQQKKTPQTEDLTEGMYQVGETVYKVKRSQAGHPYAMVLTEEGFQFERGAVKKIRPEHRMTLEDAKAYGRQTGSCCQCGRELTNESSIAAGIGPICAGKF
jgi:hypothetical protein